MKNLLTILLTFTGSWLLAQGVLNENSVITITPGTTLFIDADFTNNGTVQNNGSLFISGAWLNNKTYDAGTGTFVLSSSDDQIVNHNAQSFTNLRIVGGGRKLFRADLTIQESLVLDNGLLVAENNSKLIIAENAAIEGGSAQSYIQGPLQRNGSADLFFPIGSQTEYLPVTLSQISGNSPKISMTAFSTNSPFENNGAFTQVDTERYWRMEATNYDGAFIELPIISNNTFDKIENLVVIAANENGESMDLGQFEYNGSLSDGTVISKELAINEFYTLAELPEEGNNELDIFNVITPNGDGKHDFFNIKNIELYPNNSVSIYNRWGNELFKMSGYNNKDKLFEGIATNGTKMVTGNYQYVINKENGDKPVVGYLYIQR